jgi:hypothetical protein
MSERQWREGWRAGYEAMLAKLDGAGYWTPGYEKSADYLEGFACGMESAAWWQRGWDDGLAGRRVRRGVPEAFFVDYLTGYRAGFAAFRESSESRHAIG